MTDEERQAAADAMQRALDRRDNGGETGHGYTPLDGVSHGGTSCPGSESAR